MATTLIELESLTTKSRFVTPVQKTNNGTFVVAGADSPLITVDVNHQRSHDGRAWIAWRLYPDAAKLAAGASCNIVLAAGPDTIVHLTIDALLMGDAELYIYEGATSTGGTPFTPINRNRNYTTSSNVAMVINPTVTATGTMLDAQFLPGGTGKKAGGGGLSSLEFIFKPLTNYLIRMTNVNGTDHAGHLSLEWYE
jgi:hypothetical protein